MSSFTTCVKLVGDSNVIQMNIRPTIELRVETPYNESCMKARKLGVSELLLSMLVR